jgi:biotin operon repressor
MKDSTRAVRDYLEREYPRFVSVPELIQATRMSDVRKRISELVAAGDNVEKERNGRYVNYRFTA